MRLSSPRFKAAMLAVTLALVSSAAGATSVLPANLDQLTAGAQAIVHVRCTGNAVQADPAVGVATVTTFDVLDRAKGGAGSIFQLRQAGGELNGIAVDFHTPKFVPGAEYVLFVPPASKFGLASPVGLSQGVFIVVERDGRKEVGRGRDFTRLLEGTAASALPSGIAARMRPGSSGAEPVDLGEFMALLRTKAESR